MNPELLDALLPQSSRSGPGLLGVSEEAAGCVSVRAEGAEVLLQIVVHGGRLIVDLHHGGESCDNIVIVRVLIAVLFHRGLLETFKPGVLRRFLDKVPAPDIFVLSLKFHFNFLSNVLVIRFDLFSAVIVSNTCFSFFISPTSLEGM